MRFEILESLPVYGPIPVSISFSYSSYFSEGFVIRLYKSDETDWVANFEPGGSDLNRVIDFDDADRLLVVAGGVCYLMNPDSETPLEIFGYNFKILASVSGDRYVFADDTHLTIIEPDGSHWNTERISWDGLAEIGVDGDTVSGLSYNPTYDADDWVPFMYQLKTRTLTGGSYPLSMID